MVVWRWWFEIIMQGSQSQYLSITTNKGAIRSANVYQMLIFEWILLGYYLYMFSSVLFWQHYHSRMLLYCICFLLFDKLDLTYKYLELEDPLHLSITINCVRYLSYLCTFNLAFLLVRLVIQNHNLHVFIVMMHYLLIMGLFLNEFSKKNTKLDINVDSNNIFSKFVTPICLFVFNKTCHPSNSDYWLLQLLIFGINLFISSELNRILLMKECQYFGWSHYQQNKEKRIWNKKKSLRAIIIVSCVIIVIQNLLLIFENVKFEISVTIIHSFVVTVIAYLLYLNFLPHK